jgi:hypothetical protein
MKYRLNLTDVGIVCVLFCSVFILLHNCNPCVCNFFFLTWLFLLWKNTHKIYYCNHFKAYNSLTLSYSHNIVQISWLSSSRTFSWFQMNPVSIKQSLPQSWPLVATNLLSDLPILDVLYEGNHVAFCIWLLSLSICKHDYKAFSHNNIRTFKKYFLVAIIISKYLVEGRRCGSSSRGLHSNPSTTKRTKPKINKQVSCW